MLVAVLALLAAQPETLGLYPIEELAAVTVIADGVEIPTKIFAPMAAERFPVVGVIHGFLRDGTYQRVMAETFASRGYVAVVPDMPCGLSGCDHDANARQLSALLEWAATESAVADRIDTERRALVGHSWGGLGVHLATSIDPKIDAVVCLDPNDDRGAAYDAAPMVTAPSATVIAENIGACNNTNWGADIYPRTGTPHLRVRVVGSGHCDVEDPSDNLCPVGCGQGNPATSYLFRRYAVAFVSCVLDGANGEWIGGAGMEMDETSGIIDLVDHSGLETLPCRANVPPSDGGIVDDVGAGKDAGGEVDSSTSMDAAGTDAGTPDDAGADAIDAGAGSSLGQEASGCSATAGSPSLLVLLSFAGMMLFRRR